MRGICCGCSMGDTVDKPSGANAKLGETDDETEADTTIVSYPSLSLRHHDGCGDEVLPSDSLKLLRCARDGGNGPITFDLRWCRGRRSPCRLLSAVSSSSRLVPLTAPTLGTSERCSSRYRMVDDSVRLLGASDVADLCVAPPSYMGGGRAAEECEPSVCAAGSLANETTDRSRTRVAIVGFGGLTSGSLLKANVALIRCSDGFVLSWRASEHAVAPRAMAVVVRCGARGYLASNEAPPICLGDS